MHKGFKSISLLLGIGFLLASCYTPEKTVTRDYEETFQGVKVIELEGKFLEVTYEGKSGESEVYLNAFLEAAESSGMEISYRQSGSKLKIEVTGDLEIGWNFGNRTDGYISLTGPEDIKLNLVNGSGSIEVLNVTHDVIDLKVNSGSIKATALEVSQMNFNASSGSIKGEALTGKVNTKVNSGSILLKEVEGDVDAVASSGSLKIEDVKGLVNGKVNSGSMKFINVTELGDLSASSGNIKAENSGIGSRTSLQANSGSISIQTSSDLSAFNFDLKANSGSVKVGEQDSHKKLDINNGASATIKGNVSSGSIKIVN
jgi:lia operon protein LiaG